MAASQRARRSHMAIDPLVFGEIAHGDKSGIADWPCVRNERDQHISVTDDADPLCLGAQHVREFGFSIDGQCYVIPRCRGVSDGAVECGVPCVLGECSGSSPQLLEHLFRCVGPVHFSSPTELQVHGPHLDPDRE